MKKSRKQYPAADKVAILRRHLDEQAIEATYLLCNRDSKFTGMFDTMLKAPQTL